MEDALRFAAAITGLCFAAVLPVACSRARSVSEGQLLYQENGCGSCHGIAGHGDGLAAAALPAKPTDFRNAAFFKRGAGENEIARTLAEGIPGVESSVSELHDTHHEFLMPKFDHLTLPERRSIALYVISLRAENHPEEGMKK